MVIVGELSVSEGREEREMGDVGLGFVLWDLNVFVKMKMKMVELLEVLEM